VVDKVLEAVLSDRGHNLVTVALGVATRNATSAVCDFVKAQQQEAVGLTTGGVLGSIMQLLSSEQGEHVLSLLVTKSMRTAVETYVEVTASCNSYDDLLGSISKQVSWLLPRPLL
jgi:hypothetical protein